MPMSEEAKALRRRPGLSGHPKKEFLNTAMRAYPQAGDSEISEALKNNLWTRSRAQKEPPRRTALLKLSISLSGVFGNDERTACRIGAAG